MMAAEEYGARGVGLELQPGVVELAWTNIAERGLEEQVEISQGDFFEADLSSATLVVLYLTTNTLHRLSDKLQEVRPGTRIVTHDFALPGWPCRQQTKWTSSRGEVTPIYLYVQGPSDSAASSRSA